MTILTRTALTLLLALSAERMTAVQEPERYVAAVVDQAGALRISTRDGRTIAIPREDQQKSFAQIKISPAGDAVGWVGMQGNCCTSYDIPLQLYIYRAGRRVTFEGNRRPVWDWAFLADGRQFAFHQETVHGGMGVHYELRNLENGQLISTYDPEEYIDASGNLVSDKLVPNWVRELRSKGQARFVIPVIN